MKKTVYDFSKAIIELEEWYKPSELSLILKNAALELAPLSEYSKNNAVACLQMAVLDVCNFLDAITETEVEQ